MCFLETNIVPMFYVIPLAVSLTFCFISTRNARLNRVLFEYDNEWHTCIFFSFMPIANIISSMNLIVQYTRYRLSR